MQAAVARVSLAETLRRHAVASVEGKRMGGTEDGDESFGERLRRLRKARGYTQRRLAVLADVDSVAISRWENGKHQPSVDHIRRLADALDVTYGELVGAGQDERLIDAKLDEVLALLRELLEQRQAGEA